MPSDDIAPAPGIGKGPRHAAPRKTLMRRLQMPVGKAMALAAMPTAALMGMGFTSPLAKAGQQPENPFQPGACVELPDEPDPEPDEDGAAEAGGNEGSEAPDREAPASEPEDSGPDEGEEPEEPEEAEREPAGGEAESGAAADDPSQDQADARSEAEEAPEAEAEERPASPLDPLGEGLAELGGGLLDLITPGQADGEGDESDEGGEGGQEPPAGDRPEQPDQPEEPVEEPPEEPAGSEAEGEAPGAGETGGTGESEEPEEPDTTEEPDATEQPGATEEPGEADDPWAPDEDGLIPFPCPEQRHVPGTDETPPLPIPDEPWYLEATSLTLRGLDYHGVVNLTTAGGTEKQALKFTAEKVDIGDLHQIVDAGGDGRHHVATAPGSTSTFRDGTVTMYTERLEGRLFGVIPVVFDPEHEPPVDLPVAVFTDVHVTQAAQFGGTLTMRGMNLYTTHDGPTLPRGE